MHSKDSTAIQWLLIFLALTAGLCGQEARLVEKEGRVVVTKAGAKPAPATVGLGLVARDKLGTGESSRAVLRMSDKWFARVDEETDVEIMPGAFAAKDKDALKVALGGAFIFSREEEGEIKVQTPSATGGLRGTQLVVRVWPDGKTLMQVVEGEVDLANDFGRVQLKAGEAGEAEVGSAPHKTAVIEAHNLLQWALYYPAVLQPDELGLTGDEQKTLAASLDAYRQGDLLAALDQYPPGEMPASNGVRLYHAAVLLAAGKVDAARAAIREVPADNAGKRAVERMLAAVLGTEQPAAGEPHSAGEALAESYYQQSRRNLAAAHAAAKRATGLAPQSGFTWTRLAELDFSLGRTRAALRALDQGLKLAPRNAQAHALRGYLLSAQNRIEQAQASFEEAVRLDGGLGNAWLGLGLTKIKQGRLAEGRADLQTAVTVEPTRSFLYSYHGKALSQAGQDGLARKDFSLAKQTDPKDPTPWLYSAIQAQQEYRYGDAIRDMQESIALNDNRRVFRSQFLLDQDSAVRSSNLAAIYQNDGMNDLAVREATRAVDSDYTNPAAHLFLANSFAALLDPAQIELRYRTAWFNELMLANLLAPVGGGPLSQVVSQQEYSKLLAADGTGGSLNAEWRSGGYMDVQASAFSTQGRLSTGVDLIYHRDNGTRPNNDDLRRELYWQLKYQPTADDVLYSLVQWRDQRGGDLFENYANQSVNVGNRFDDKNSPGYLLFGWNHSWAPGMHTIFLGGRLESQLEVTSPYVSLDVIRRDSRVLQPGFLETGLNGTLQYTSPNLRNAPTPPASSNPDDTLNLSADFQREIAPFLGVGRAGQYGAYGFKDALKEKIVIYTAELEHIWQTSRNTFLAGGRWQGGPFETTARLDMLDQASSLARFFTSPADLQQVRVNFERESIYAYDFLTVAPWLTLIGGGSWDRLKYPDNFSFAPVNGRQVEKERTNGKFGFTLTPSPWVTIRGASMEALGGVTNDGDVRLEPVQFAGFNQAFRTVISESVASSVEAPVYRNNGLSIEGSLPTRTWWSASVSDLRESVHRTLGSFDFLVAPVFPHGQGILPAGTPEDLAYRERVFTAGVNQLIGREFAVNATYRHTRAELHDSIPEIRIANYSVAALDELLFGANWNSPVGYFAHGEAHWYAQDLGGYVTGQSGTVTPGDNFWQYNLQGGYRFHHNQREVSLGVLNLSDRAYHLSPLTNLPELPRSRTLVVRCRLSF